MNKMFFELINYCLYHKDLFIGVVLSGIVTYLIVSQLEKKKANDSNELFCLKIYEAGFHPERSEIVPLLKSTRSIRKLARLLLNSETSEQFSNKLNFLIKEICKRHKIKFVLGANCSNYNKLS